MFPFFGFRNLQKSSLHTKSAIEKMNRGQLTVEDLLDEEDLVNDLRSYTFSQLMTFLNQENLKKIINYIINDPERDDHKIGHKYPYNASEILCSENLHVVDKFFEDSQGNKPDDEDEEETQGGEPLNNDEPGFTGRGSIIFEQSGKVEKVSGDVEEMNSDIVCLEEEIRGVTLDSQITDRIIQSEKEFDKTEDLDNQQTYEYPLTPKEKLNSSQDFKNLNSDLENKIADQNSISGCIDKIIEEVFQQVEQVTLLDQVEQPHQIQQVEQFPLSVPETSDKIKDKKILDFPLINHLFTMLENNSQLCYVLAGYFYKVFNHLSNFRQGLLCAYIYEHKPEFSDLLIKHANKKSISDCLLKLLVSFPSYENEKSDPSCLNEIFEEKKVLVNKILEEVKLKYSSIGEEEKVENLLDVLSESMLNRRIYYLFAKNKELLEKIYNLINDPDVLLKHGTHIFKFLIKFIEHVVRDTLPTQFSNKDEKKEGQEEEIENLVNYNRINKDTKFKIDLDLKSYLEIFNIIYDFIEPITKDFIRDTNNLSLGNFTSTYDQESRVLGMLKLQEFEYIKTIIELLNNVLNNPGLVNIEIISLSVERLIERLIESRVFSKCVEYFFKHEMNNFYQNTFEKLMELIVNKSMSEKLINDFFDKEECQKISNSENEDEKSNIKVDFLGKIISNTFTNSLSFRTGNWILPGYIATMCDVAYLIGQSENEYLKRIIEKNDEWRYLYYVCFQHIKTNFEKGLLYNKSQIESPFQKFVSPIQDLISNNYEKKFKFRNFIQIECKNKFEIFIEKKMKEGTIDIDKYIKEEESTKNLEESNLAVSIPLGDLNENSMIESRDGSSREIVSYNEFENAYVEEVIQLQADSDLYCDTYFWSKINVDNIDLSEL